jgi:hypothetical protein
MRKTVVSLFAMAASCGVGCTGQQSRHSHHAFLRASFHEGLSVHTLRMFTCERGEWRREYAWREGGRTREGEAKRRTEQTRQGTETGKPKGIRGSGCVRRSGKEKHMALAGGTGKMLANEHTALLFPAVAREVLTRYDTHVSIATRRKGMP